ncbi:MAG TPA: ATP:cob(I)alamin adenosyltransferase [Elusimicrobiales bacterium]|nr:ATP:cob(I)alamin adenosyltransferase [Elusimicrobiales bacterium]
MYRTFKPDIGSGDGGVTDLPGGKRVKKTAPVITALALLDDLNAHIGLAAAVLTGKGRADLRRIQRALFTAAAHAAGAGRGKELERPTAELTARIAALSKGGVPAGFAVPGRTRAGALLHIARTRARLCELALWRIDRRHAAKYLNRLSDLLFLLAEKRRITSFRER